MVDGADYLTLLRVAFFFFSILVAGKACKLIAVSPIIGEIAVGVALGPECLNVVPYPSAFDLAGIAGVTLLLFESGLHVDFAQLQVIGVRSGAIAVVGTCLPLASTAAILWSIDPVRYPPWPVGLAGGAALAPTSVGMALKLLADAGTLRCEVGQVVVAAAFLDDVLSLALLTSLLDVGTAEAMGTAPSAWGAAKAILWSAGLCFLAGVLAYPRERGVVGGREESCWRRGLCCLTGVFPRLAPSAIRHLAEWFGSRAARGNGLAPAEAPPELRASMTSAGLLGFDDDDEEAEANLVVRYHLSPLRDLHYVTINAMFATLVVYSTVAQLMGSHVLGSFLAGVSFCWLPGAVPLWHSQVRRFGSWLVRCFFSCTVAFSIPVRSMVGVRSFALGMALLAGPGFLAKALPGIMARPGDRALVGAAMIGRGEFAFLCARALRATVLNPAPRPLAEDLERALWAGELGPAPGGGFCVNCRGRVDGLLASAAINQAIAGRERHEGEVQGIWCAPAHCDGDGATACEYWGPNATLSEDLVYWRSGPDCDAHAEACVCEAMLPADAFSIVVWALVGAAVVAPLYFGAVLRYAGFAGVRPPPAYEHALGNGGGPGAEEFHDAEQNLPKRHVGSDMN